MECWISGVMGTEGLFFPTLQYSKLLHSITPAPQRGLAGVFESWNDGVRFQTKRWCGGVKRLWSTGVLE